MKKYILLLLILILAFVLRVVNLSSNPPSVYGDEISFAWNAWSILHTGADEHGIVMPLQFKAFDDYKSPIPVYFLVPIFKVFGMNVWSLRLPVVLVSILTIWVTYLLVYELFSYYKVKERTSKTIALLSAFLLTISPWHIHLSRGYFEATLALLPFVAGNYFFIKAFKKPQFFYLSFFSFALSLYTYFTPRMILLVFLPFITWYFRTEVLKHKKVFVYATVLFFALSVPLVKLALFDGGGHRFQWLISERLKQSAEQATVELPISQGPWVIRKLLHNRYIIFVSKVTNDYVEHFSFNFWYLFGDNSLRYFLGSMGMFYIVELPFLLVGLYGMIHDHKKISGYLLGWLLIAPLPAALVGRSFAVRSIAMLPVPFIFVGYGITETLAYFKNKGKQYLQLAVVSVVSLFVMCLTIYLLRYHLDYPRYAATWWGWENKAALDYAKLREDQYDQIFISDFYTGAPLAYAFYYNYDPILYRQAIRNPLTIADDRHVIKLGKYYFGSLDLDEKRLVEGVLPPKTLYIGRPAEPKGRETIAAPDDLRVLFQIHYTD